MPIRDPEARREYNRKWMANRRANFFKGKTCVGCGSSEDLELDHLDPTVKVSHRIWSWSEGRREEELAKCQVLCKSCHLVKTKIDLHKMNKMPLVHGTLHGYKHHNCRCPACRQALLDYWKFRRQNHSEMV